MNKDIKIIEIKATGSGSNKKKIENGKIQLYNYIISYNYNQILVQNSFCMLIK